MAGEYHGFGIKFPTKCILLQATVPVLQCPVNLRSKKGI